MKNTKQNYKTLIVASLVVMAVAFSPLVGYANNDNGKSNSIWNRFSRFFVGTEVSAQANKMPVISGITAPTVLQTGQVGTWKVKAYDPENGSLSYAVDWGDNNRLQPFANRAALLFEQDSTFTHAYAKAGKYTVKFTVSDEAGLKTTSTVTVNVRGAPVAQAPVISNLSAKSDKPTKATIRWMTDVRASSMVWIQKNSPVDTAGTPDVSRPAKIFNHKIKLNQLEPGTKYYVVVGSANGGGTTLSSEVSFTTPNNKKAPEITDLMGPTTVEVGDTATITVKAFDPNNSPLSYSVNWSDGMSIMSLFKAEESFVQTSTFDHVYTRAGVYTATFTVENEAGLKDSASVKITVVSDETDPVISNVTQSALTSTGVTIFWTTDEPSDSEVFYSTTTPVDVSTAPSVSSDALVTSHSLNISGLTANTLYHFKIESSDESGNTSVSSESSFTTSAAI